jgi:hypothetical protein
LVLVLASPFVMLGYLLLSPMMFLKVVLISALSGVVVFSLFDMWPDSWRQMSVPKYLEVAVVLVVCGFMGLIGLGYALAVIGLWPLYVLQ